MGILLILLGILPHEGAVYDTVDCMEINHFYDDAGRKVFEQVIFWDYDITVTVKGEDYYLDEAVRAWRLIKHPSQVPFHDHAANTWSAIWYDGDVLRHVSAKTVTETWTQYDRELSNRQLLPKEHRADLSDPPKPRVIRAP
jgi:hypothetical protein